MQTSLAAELCRLTGFGRVFFCNSGAEANECAIKLARKYSADKYGKQRTEIVTLVNSFHGRTVTTLEGLQEEAKEFGAFIADQGAEQCGFCNPGMIMNAIALFRENPEPTDEEIKQYLAGNLCRCSGYEGQLRGMHAFIEYKKNGGAACGK